MVAVGLAGCGSSQRSGLGRPLPSVATKGISISFPAGTCAPAKVGQPFSTWIVLQGGVPPYGVTWYVNGHVGGLDIIQVEKTGPSGDPIYANGTKYTITFTPRSSTDQVTLRVVDSQRAGVHEELKSAIIGAGSPCSISP